MAQQTQPASGAGGPAPAPVASGNPAVKAGHAAGGTSAQASVPLFGGNRGGRKRTDGLAPGSPEALEADRKKDRERKQAARAVAEPPPLPSAVAPAGNQVAPPLGTQIPGAAAAVSEPEVPWDPEILKPLVEEAVEASEAKRISDFTELAQAARLGEGLVKEVGKDAQYNPAFKKSVNSCAPRVLAKWLNRSPISGKYSEEAILGASVVAIWMQGRSLQARLERLIEEAKKANENKKIETPKTSQPNTRVPTS